MTNEYSELDLIDLTPISERDRPEHERYQKTKGYDVPNWYKKVYLNTDHWEMVKRNCASHYKGSCQLCGIIHKPFHVHHNNYKHFWKERFADVTYLCSRHHQLFHNCIQFNKDTGEPEIEKRLREYFEIQKEINELEERWRKRKLEYSERRYIDLLKYCDNFRNKLGQELNNLPKKKGFCCGKEIGELFSDFDIRIRTHGYEIT